MNLKAVLKRAEGIKANYLERPQSEVATVLLYGDYATGKTTTAITTVPEPVHVDMFDPGGERTRAVREAAQDPNRNIIIDNRWQNDSWKKPWAFKAWEQDFRARLREGYFEAMGTYVLDSITYWSNSMMYRILEMGGKKSGSRTGSTPELQDYMTQQLTAVDYIGQFTNLPCHVVVTGHIGMVRDEVTGSIQTGLLLAGKLSEKVPLAFCEKYVARVEMDAGTRKHFVQCHTDKRYQAETRIGAGLLNDKEPQDLRAIFKKCGISYEDKDLSTVEDSEEVETNDEADLRKY